MRRWGTITLVLFAFIVGFASTYSCGGGSSVNAGGDADTLEGYSASAFALSSHSHPDYATTALLSSHVHSEYALTNHDHTDYTEIGHTHPFTDITSTALIQQLPVGTGSNEIAAGNHAHSAISSNDSRLSNLEDRLNSGLILMNAGRTSWVKHQPSSNVDMVFADTHLAIHGLLPGDYQFTNSPALPTVLYGKALQFNGVEFCYNATDSGLYIETVYLTVSECSSGGTSDTTTYLVDDLTDRNDNTCRYYTPSTPVELTPDDIITFRIHLKWTSADRHFYIGRTTFVFEPSNTSVNTF